MNVRSGEPGVRWPTFAAIFLSGLAFVRHSGSAAPLDTRRMVRIWESIPAGDASVSRPTFERWRRAASLEDVTALRVHADALVGRGDCRERVLVAHTTVSFFTLARAQPVVGRPFRGADEAVVSHALWQRHFRESQGLGASLKLSSGAAYRVVGVLPREFEFPWIAGADVLVQYGSRTEGDREDRHLQVYARLAAGASVAAAESELDALTPATIWPLDQVPPAAVRRRAATHL